MLATIWFLLTVYNIPLVNFGGFMLG